MSVKNIRNFLKSFAINVEEETLEYALECASLEKHKKPGSFFKTLLFETGRVIDWKLAEELEREYQSKTQ